ncbi:unnamed protein product [Schistosoma curassoni]|uniref:Uncharacterized protein n=1 Tax=Schistosoma curassoni TaxID=6186 RepID=A0A183KSW7_9TREM|nr:unnamed protein product [Schistosoma curassoni]
MVVGGSRQETLNPGFVPHGTRQQGVPVILRELVLPGGSDPVNYICGSHHELTSAIMPEIYLAKWMKGSRVKILELLSYT